MPAGARAVLPAAREQLAADAAALQRLRPRRRARSPRPPRGSARARRPRRGRRARPPSCRRDRCSADGGCARAGAPRARPPARRRRSCRAPRRRRGRRRPRPPRAWGGCRRRASHAVKQPRRAPMLYPSRSPMAVPKQKQSHSRTSKRRAQHKISAPTYNACPTCHSPRLPHRVCPTCGSYARPRGRARARPRSRPRALARLSSLPACPSRSRSTPTAPTSGPQKSPRARRTQPSRGSASCSSGPPSEFGEVAEGIEVVDAPVSIAKAPDPVARQPLDPDASIVLRHARGRRGRRRRASSAAARPAPRWRPACSTSSARRGIHRPALAIPVPVPGHPVTHRRRRRQRRGARRAPRPVRLHGRRAGPGRARRRAPARRPALDRRGGQQGHAARRRGARRPARPPGRGRHLRLRRQRRGQRGHRRARPTSS